MKTTWISPALTVYGSVQDLTQVQKTFGGDDGLTATINISSSITVPIGDPKPGQLEGIIDIGS